MFLIRTKKSCFYWYKPSKGLEQSFYRFGTFQFTMERLHFIVEHLTFYIGIKQFFYGTKRIKNYNVCVYIGSLTLFSGKSDVQQWNKMNSLWNKTNKLCDKNFLFWNI